MPVSVQNQVGWGLEQPGLVEDVPAYGRMVGLDDLQGPCGRKITLSHSFTGYSSASENLLQFFLFQQVQLECKKFLQNDYLKQIFPQSSFSPVKMTGFEQSKEFTFTGVSFLYCSII